MEISINLQALELEEKSAIICDQITNCLEIQANIHGNELSSFLDEIIKGDLIYQILPYCLEQEFSKKYIPKIKTKYWTQVFHSEDIFTNVPSIIKSRITPGFHHILNSLLDWVKNDANVHEINPSVKVRLFDSLRNYNLVDRLYNFNSNDIKKLCLTKHQIYEFCYNHTEKLIDDDNQSITFFLYYVNFDFRLIGFWRRKGMVHFEIASDRLLSDVIFKDYLKPFRIVVPWNVVPR